MTYIEIMRRNEGLWKTYVVHAKDGSLTWEAHDGLVYVAHSPEELEEQMTEERNKQ